MLLDCKIHLISREFAVHIKLIDRLCLLGRLQTFQANTGERVINLARPLGAHVIDDDCFHIFHFSSPRRYNQRSVIGMYNPWFANGTYSNPRPNGSSYRTVVQSMPMAE